MSSGIMEQQMQDLMESSIFRQDELALECVKGKFINELYIKCPHISKPCKWRMSSEQPQEYKYLSGACFLSGRLELDCPE